MLGLGRIRWALRKLVLPVASDGLVLDVGSGGCPYPRSDVLLEKYLGAIHRTGGRLIADRPLVLGDAERMPFKDKAFDFVIASHVLEHMSQPERFLGELMRVARAGYIETPNALFERLNPYDIHCLEITDAGGRLHIRKKSSWRDDEFLGSLGLLQGPGDWGRLFRAHPELFHVRYFWRDRIDFEIANPELSVDWLPEASTDVADWDFSHAEGYLGEGWRAQGLRAARRWYERTSRRKVSLDELLACPKCRGALARIGEEYQCQGCGAAYQAEPVPNLLEPIRE